MANYSVGSYTANVMKSDSGVSIQLIGEESPSNLQKGTIIQTDAAKALFYALNHFFYGANTENLAQSTTPDDCKQIVIEGLQDIITRLIEKG